MASITYKTITYGLSTKPLWLLLISPYGFYNVQKLTYVMVHNTSHCTACLRRTFTIPSGNELHMSAVCDETVNLLIVSIWQCNQIPTHRFTIHVRTVLALEINFQRYTKDLIQLPTLTFNVLRILELVFKFFFFQNQYSIFKNILRT